MCPVQGSNYATKDQGAFSRLFQGPVHRLTCTGTWRESG